MNPLSSWLLISRHGQFVKCCVYQTVGREKSHDIHLPRHPITKTATGQGWRSKQPSDPNLSNMTRSHVSLWSRTISPAAHLERVRGKPTFQGWFSACRHFVQQEARIADTRRRPQKKHVNPWSTWKKQDGMTCRNFATGGVAVSNTKIPEAKK